MIRRAPRRWSSRTEHRVKIRRREAAQCGHPYAVVARAIGEMPAPRCTKAAGHDGRHGCACGHGGCTGFHLVQPRPLLPGWRWHCSCTSWQASETWSHADAVAGYVRHLERATP